MHVTKMQHLGCGPNGCSVIVQHAASSNSDHASDNGCSSKVVVGEGMSASPVLAVSNDREEGGEIQGEQPRSVLRSGFFLPLCFGLLGCQL